MLPGGGRAARATKHGGSLAHQQEQRRGQGAGDHGLHRGNIGRLLLLGARHGPGGEGATALAGAPGGPSSKGRRAAERLHGLNEQMGSGELESVLG